MVNETGTPVVSATYQLDNFAPKPIPILDGSFSLIIDRSQLGAGSHQLKVTARDSAGNVSTSTIPVTMSSRIPFRINGITPSDGTRDVGSTYRPHIYFTRPVDVNTLNESNFYATDTTGTSIPATIVPAADGSFAWLFSTIHCLDHRQSRST